MEFFEIEAKKLLAYAPKKVKKEGTTVRKPSIPNPKETIKAW